MAPTAPSGRPSCRRRPSADVAAPPSSGKRYARRPPPPARPPPRAPPPPFSIAAELTVVVAGHRTGVRHRRRRRRLHTDSRACDAAADAAPPSAHCTHLHRLGFAGTGEEVSCRRRRLPKQAGCEDKDYRSYTDNARWTCAVAARATTVSTACRRARAACARTVRGAALVGGKSTKTGRPRERCAPPRRRLRAGGRRRSSSAEAAHRHRHRPHRHRHRQARRHESQRHPTRLARRRRHLSPCSTAAVAQGGEGHRPRRTAPRTAPAVAAASTSHRPARRCAGRRPPPPPPRNATITIIAAAVIPAASSSSSTPPYARHDAVAAGGGSSPESAARSPPLSPMPMPMPSPPTLAPPLVQATSASRTATLTPTLTRAARLLPTDALGVTASLGRPDARRPARRRRVDSRPGRTPTAMWGVAIGGGVGGLLVLCAAALVARARCHPRSAAEGDAAEEGRRRARCVMTLSRRRALKSSFNGGARLLPWRRPGGRAARFDATSVRRTACRRRSGGCASPRIEYHPATHGHGGDGRLRRRSDEDGRSSRASHRVTGRLRHGKVVRRTESQMAAPADHDVGHRRAACADAAARHRRLLPVQERLQERRASGRPAAHRQCRLKDVVQSPTTSASTTSTTSDVVPLAPKNVVPTVVPTVVPLSSVRDGVGGGARRSAWSKRGLRRSRPSNMVLPLAGALCGVVPMHKVCAGLRRPVVVRMDDANPRERDFGERRTAVRRLLCASPASTARFQAAPFSPYSTLHAADGD